jgi:SET domain-containing protein
MLSTIKKSKIHGKGVFSTSEILKNQIIEVCHVVVMPIEESMFLDKTFLQNYYFEFDEHKSIALPGGNLMFYNHSKNPNCKLSRNFKKNTINILAKTNIKKNSELFIDYVDTWFPINEISKQ